LFCPIRALNEPPPPEALDRFLALGMLLVLDAFSAEEDCIFEEVFDLVVEFKGVTSTT
jgi:hypothetical protein